MKRILGVFRSTRSERIGSGTTAKERVRDISWFVMESGKGEYVVQPLMENNLPSGISQTIPRDTFHSSYKVDALRYRRHIYPVLQSLRGKIGKVAGFVGSSSLADDEKTVFKALAAAVGNGGSPAGKYKVVKHLLANLEDAGEVLESYRHEIVRDSIAMRKAGKLDMALEVYKRALELNDHDDHLLFNMARVYHSMERGDEAVQCLVRALNINSQLSPARKMYRYLTKEEFEQSAEHAPMGGGGERRREERIAVPGFSVAGRFSGFMASMLVKDVSCRGVQFELSSKLAKPVEAGASFTLEGVPGKFEELLGSCRVKVVWLNKDRIGGRFQKPVCKSTDLLADILFPDEQPA